MAPNTFWTSGNVLAEARLDRRPRTALPNGRHAQSSSRPEAGRSAGDRAVSPVVPLGPDGAAVGIPEYVEDQRKREHRQFLSEQKPSHHLQDAHHPLAVPPEIQVPRLPFEPDAAEDSVQRVGLGEHVLLVGADVGNGYPVFGRGHFGVGAPEFNASHVGRVPSIACETSLVSAVGGFVAVSSRVLDCTRRGNVPSEGASPSSGFDIRRRVVVRLRSRYISRDGTDVFLNQLRSVPDQLRDIQRSVKTWTS